MTHYYLHARVEPLDDATGDVGAYLDELAKEINGSNLALIEFIGEGFYLAAEADGEDADLETLATFSECNHGDKWAMTDELNREIDDEIVTIAGERYVAVRQE